MTLGRILEGRAFIATHILARGGPDTWRTRWKYAYVVSGKRACKTDESQKHDANEAKLNWATLNWTSELTTESSEEQATIRREPMVAFLEMEFKIKKGKEQTQPQKRRDQKAQK